MEPRIIASFFSFACRISVNVKMDLSFCRHKQYRNTLKLLNLMKTLVAVFMCLQQHNSKRDVDISAMEHTFLAMLVQEGTSVFFSGIFRVAASKVFSDEALKKPKTLQEANSEYALQSMMLWQKSVLGISHFYL